MTVNIKLYRINLSNQMILKISEAEFQKEINQLNNHQQVFWPFSTDLVKQVFNPKSSICLRAFWCQNKIVIHVKSCFDDIKNSAQTRRIHSLSFITTQTHTRLKYIRAGQYLILICQFVCWFSLFSSELNYHKFPNLLAKRFLCSTFFSSFFIFFSMKFIPMCRLWLVSVYLGGKTWYSQSTRFEMPSHAIVRFYQSSVRMDGRRFINANNIAAKE